MRTNTATPWDLQEQVDRELEPGERIEWMDMPIPRFFTPATTSAFLFAIPWTAFAIFWMCGAAGFEMPDFKKGADLFPLFGIPFVLIGAVMLSSPLRTRRKALRTVYVITNKRAITIEGGWSTTIHSYLPDKLRETYRRVRKDGSGDVVIARRAWNDSEGSRQSEELGFLRIRNPKEVEQMLRKLAEAR